ncbi:MAG TPA: hypothetical protein DCP97_05210 [Ruminococcaceae bacterium]|nr:hypothetical protein [Oscillospiraceae bacterium]
MNTLDLIIEKAKAALNTASKKTGEAVEYSKNKLNEMQLTAELEKAFQKLGAVTYDIRRTGKDNQKLVDICMNEIDELSKRINEIKAKIKETKSTVACSECGKENPKDFTFCSACGAPLKVVVQADYEVMNDEQPQYNQNPPKSF